MSVKSRSKIIACAACCLSVLALGACGGDPDVVRVVSYVAVDSEVYGTASEVVRHVADSVVEIQTESVTTRWGMQYIVSGAGSGVIVAHEEDFGKYYIVTNNHVIDGANSIRVSLRSGESYNSTLVATDVAGDIAVLSIDEESTLNVAVWGESGALQIGEDVIAIGNPLGSLGGTVTKGIISATARSIPVGNYTMTLLQTDTAINPGNSGGGLFNMRGQLVGIVNAKTSDEEVEGICFAIPSDIAFDIYTDLVTDGVVKGRVTLGIKVSLLSTSDAVVVSGLSGAADGTFALYDKIAEINGVAINSMLAYNDALAALKPNDTVSVKVYRGEMVQNGWYGSSIRFDSDPTSFTVVAGQLQAKRG